MSEPSTHIPGEVADAQVDQTAAPDGSEQSGSEQSGSPEAAGSADKVELHLDEDKLEAWDEVKADYQVDPDADSETGSDATPAAAED